MILSHKVIPYYSHSGHPKIFVTVIQVRVLKARKLQEVGDQGAESVYVHLEVGEQTMTTFERSFTSEPVWDEYMEFIVRQVSTIRMSVSAYSESEVADTSRIDLKSKHVAGCSLNPINLFLECFA